MENNVLNDHDFIDPASDEAHRVFAHGLALRPDHQAKVAALVLACYNYLRTGKLNLLDNNPDVIKEAVFLHERSAHAPEFWIRFAHLTGIREYSEQTVRRDTIMYTAKHKEELAAKAADKSHVKTLAHYVPAYHLTAIAEITVYAAERAALDHGCRNSISSLLAEEKSASAKALRFHKFFIELMGYHLAHLVDTEVKAMLREKKEVHAKTVPAQVISLL